MGSLSMDDCDFEAWLDLDFYDDDDAGSSGASARAINDSIVVHHDHDDHHDHDRHDDDRDQELVQYHYEYSEVESEVERFLRESYSNLVDSEPNVGAAEAASRISEEQRLEVERFLRESYENLVNPQPPNYYDRAIVVDDNEPPNREIDQQIPSPSDRKRGKMADEVEWPSSHSQPNKKRKMKTLKVSASALCIGTWQCVAKNQEDVVTKCYYAKKRLIWELLENGLKKKIEIHWDQISAMRVINTESGHMILEIEVREPPSFFHEKEPQPGHHTMWENATDFTEGNALTYRIHSMQFSPGVFDKPYKQLLQYVPRFELMCRAPFPTPGASPRFVEFDLEFGEDIYADCKGAKSPIKALPHDYEASAASAKGPENALNAALAIRQTGISPAATDQIIHHQWQSTPYDHDHECTTVIHDESLSLTDPERRFLFGEFAPWHGPADHHHERLYSHQGLCGELGDFEADIDEWRSFCAASALASRDGDAGPEFPRLTDYERRMVLEQPEPNGPTDCPATATSDGGGPIGQVQNYAEASASQENGQNSAAREDQPSFEFVRESVVLLSTMDLGPYNFS